MTEIKSPRHAATLVLIRDTPAGPRVLMGQRGAGAAFMPSKYVFPGGAVDDADHALAPRFDVHEADEERLRARADPAVTPAALALAALRETWEETGLALGSPDSGAAALAKSAAGDWRGFFASGLRPATTGIRFIFRAITPPARSRRFDARFFLADAGLIAGDPDDLSNADGELAHLRWLTLADARSLDLPFITEVVLSEVEARLKAPDMPRPTPFFHHDEGRSHLDHL
ncbi:DNA mismatch repair protein MutT [Pikeienuella piscinae]|uniref:DNA mismatch repair protein MutT n=1 Tax=Pikeienuella piscinae TaxID=2748098 RepID=A0A7L5C181_9RHOB|nr:DNA mismatch repair protein MutT [Pikeienuella piscinae]QIE55904.1 DNA mismatch repair protein MutT [Pikeienuella piscinae]